MWKRLIFSRESETVELKKSTSELKEATISLGAMLNKHSKGKIVQYAGRLHRYHHAKHDIRIYDYVDAQLPVLERMFKRRAWIK